MNKIYKFISLLAIVALLIGCGNDDNDNDITNSSDITEHFDVKFAAALQIGEYIPDASKILFSQVKNIKSVIIYSPPSFAGNIPSLDGIEFFQELDTLHCSDVDLESLDVSKNTKLTNLNISYNKLVSVDLSKNTLLKTFKCDDNKIVKIDLSRNTKLTDLNISRNKFASVDLSKNTELSLLNLSYNELTTLDLSKNTELILLDVTANLLTSMDIRKNNLLVRLYCMNNPGVDWKFVVKAWFDNTNIPQGFTVDNWGVVIDYQK